VATELNRIRGFFDRVRAAQEGGDEPPHPPRASKDPGAWPTGTRVRSPRFGAGVITASTGSGDGLTYTVRFEQAGEKRIVARFGMLEKEG
jgi:DNA helicase-2/ATP-dependent DNA helicase PcrA